MFDPESFLNTPTSDATSTEYVPLPAGVYVASVSAVAVKQMDSGAVALNLTWKVSSDDPDLDGRSVRQTVWLDITPAGSLNSSRGKNVKLGLLREALRQNTPGVAWTPQQMVGAMARVDVYHRPDRDDPSRVYEDVKGVTAF